MQQSHYHKMNKKRLQSDFHTKFLHTYEVASLTPFIVQITSICIYESVALIEFTSQLSLFGSTMQKYIN